MAEMIFETKTLDGKIITPESVLSYEWTRDADAACDGLRLSFLSEPIGEAAEIRAYYNGSLVFNGFCDYQSESDGKTFVYARSLTALLVDNEAAQITLNSPCVSALFYLNAKPFGFKNRIKNYSLNADYTVQKGTSCYGAINNFVRRFTDNNIAVSPGGELYIPKGDVKYTVNPESVINSVKVINRGNAVSRVDFKTDGEYNRHRISKALSEKGINRSRRVNLFALEDFKKETAAGSIIKNSARDYYSGIITVTGVVCAELGSPVVYEGFEGYRISALKTAMTKEGITTKISLNKSFDLKEADYVD